MEEVLTQASLCRDVTADEIAHYHDHGWTRLPGFLSADVTAELLRIARERMGEDGRGNLSDFAATVPDQQAFYNPEFASGLTHPLMRPLLFDAGRNAKRLMARGDTDVRYFADLFAPKLPAASKAYHGAMKTLFHQDYTNWALDRSGGMTFWIALVDLEPEAGTMSFVNGSHLNGAMGHYRSYGDGDALNAYPELTADNPPTSPARFAAGDATVHSNLCIHGASENRTDKPRWIYSISVNPADSRWNGAWTEVFDTKGMTQYQLLDDARFPIISTPL